MGRPFEERGLHADVVARVPDRISALSSLTWSDSLHAPGWSDSLPMTTDPVMPGMISLLRNIERIDPSGHRLHGVGAAGRVRGLVGRVGAQPDDGVGRPSP